MIVRYSSVEHSRQNVPRTSPEEVLSLAESRPLHELSDIAPKTGLREYDLKDVRYSFSNDESPRYFDQTRVRASLPEFREASNRTAILIGESSLIAALPFLEEDTIILLDSSPVMCEFMSRYVDGLKKCKTIEEWLNFIGLEDEENQDTFATFTFRIREQIREWEQSGYTHGLNSQDAYDAARKAVEAKAFIPWCADLTDEKAMKQLGEALKTRDANVTFMNLTNALPCTSRFDESRKFAKRLEHLPVTPNAPILTTGGVRKGGNGYIVEATGPFFGLENLKKFGGRTYDGWMRRELGPIARRQYALESGVDKSFDSLTELGGIAITVVQTTDGRDMSVMVGGLSSSELDSNPELRNYLRSLHLD